ncbi:WbbJ Acetyltransferase (isoleucine patch superfamily) [Candidatus Methylopumilus universalis]|uniref:acetyltransferase n=1 Tax=Candidatus Methylopumilus universalis TaxID=2588536 RepID=UPI003BEF447C
MSSKKKLIIFGIGELAEIALFYFYSDSDFEVIAFTVDKSYISTSNFKGLPIVPFEDLEEIYPPSEGYHLFIAIGFSLLNETRKLKYLLAKSLGYKIASYISSKATILNENKIGEHAFILENNTIQPFAKIGKNVTIWSGNHIGHHSFISDHVFITSHTVISGGVQIEEQCFLGVNCTIRDHIKIGQKSIIGAGSIILKDVEPFGIYSVKSTERSLVPSSKIKKI